MKTCQEIYPSPPLLRSAEKARPRAAHLLSLDYFEAHPDAMPAEVFSQHHILINLGDAPQRLENWRGDEYRDHAERACEMLAGSSRSLIDIAPACGFFGPAAPDENFQTAAGRNAESLPRPSELKTASSWLARRRALRNGRPFAALA